MGQALAIAGLHAAIWGSIAAVLFSKDQDIWGVGVILAMMLIVIACLSIGTDAGREAARTRLSLVGYRPWYEAAMNRALGFGLRLLRLERVEPEDRHIKGFLAAAFRYELLDRALLFATAYPLLLLFLAWSFGQEGRLGAAVVLEAEPRGWVRAVAFGLAANILLSPFYEKWAAASPRPFWRSVAGWLPFLAVAVAAAVAFAVASAVAFALASAVAFVFAGAVAGASAVAFASAVASSVAVASTVALAGAFAGAVALASAVEFLYRSDRRSFAALLSVLVPIVVLVATLSWLDWDSLAGRPAVLGIFLFLGVLPLINGLFDSVSYLVTLVATQAGLARRGHPVLWAIADLLAALLLFFALGGVLVFVVATMNRVTGVEFADLGGMLANLDDWRSYWWAYAMVFSTVVPTLVHFVNAALSLQSLPLVGPVRTGLRRLIRRSETDALAAFLAPLSLASVWALSIGLPFGLLASAVWLAWTHGFDFYLGAYQDWLIGVAHRFGGF